MWLPTLVSTLFLAEAVWRFVDEGSGVEQRATAKFNGVNIAIFALLGLSCVSWPFISAKCQGQKDEKNVDWQKFVNNPGGDWLGKLLMIVRQRIKRHA